MSESRGFLSRWALRKQQAQQGEELPDEVEIPSDSSVDAEATPIDSAAASVQDVADPVSEATPATDEEQILTAEDLPDPENIEVGGSFASFMAKNVDPSVRQNALRALWKQPHFSEIDGMMEYALDYSNQEILTPEVSSELAKKVFRHLVKDEEKPDDVVEPEIAAQDDMPDAQLTADVDEQMPAEIAEQAPELIESTDSTDKMDGEVVQLSQNDPLAAEKNNERVV
ncbi:DUF3306 domain-containing protein [Shewanella avicenniae]|uniref:DUF3306 domain-containing protein n=1 Tax=Shewanella avicenniae TaxID=2814294 RepID=A0ABX7QRR3_9GAMM|nr:DUF3306 domain-containing protein [Shewanella avicenniae]QSX33568.1 DUF3306 domain-containing protein [Shewanella avicenniae]